jgi:3-methyladenine DNA glycosylase AlkD
MTAMNAKVDTADVITWLKRTGSKQAAAKLARYGLPTDNAYGISVAVLQQYAKRIGKDHDLSMRLWKTGSLDARILAAFLGDPAKVTIVQMNAWCGDFDNWGTTDTACFKLFDQSPLAWKVVAPWTKKKGEFQRRAGFVMMACLAQHDKAADDAAFLTFLPIIEQGAGDERNYVKKGVSWALRGIGHRNQPLHAASVALARRLAESEDRTERWVGKDVLRDLTRPLVVRKVSARSR